MSPALVLAIVGGALIAAGAYLVLERSLLRILAGIMLAGNGINVLFLVVAGPAGLPPFVGSAAGSELADPLPQAFVLTAIVITVGIGAFMLALSYRSMQIDGHDEVSDDIEDRIIRRRAEADLTSEAHDDFEPDTEIDPEAVET